MAIKLGQEVATLTAQERTWRVEMFCEFGEVPTLVAHREIVKTDASGALVTSDRSVGQVRRSLTEIANADLGGMTGSQMAEAIANAVDTLRKEDIERQSK